MMSGRRNAQTLEIPNPVFRGFEVTESMTVRKTVKTTRMYVTMRGIDHRRTLFAAARWVQKLSFLERTMREGRKGGV
jgi:hypothetical protein